ncbi:MAG: UDP-N-acetylmuramoyl-L-alanine--D-glutamate ligase [Eubacteriales bacterium]|nr:UDP-N-acetylmuramoyl-L-alanine--D-glutamate ligase [Eubacteriales bacterium]
MELNNKKVLIFGSGKSGIGAARLLLARHAVPVIYDGNVHADKEAIIEKLGQPCEIILGDISDKVLDTLDLVIMSPGVPCDLPVVDRFRAKKLPIWGEIELAYQIGKGKVLAVTGTNGKTTTVTLLGEIMKDFYPEVYVVGNIGTPYTDVVLEQTENAYTVAEVSSFQLETIDTFHPIASALTNITEDHLNRHHTMEEYIRCKARVTENQTPEDVCVLNYEDEVLRAFGEKCPAEVIFFSSSRVLEKGIYLEDNVIKISDGQKVLPVVRTDELQILGLHNFENIMVAAAMAHHAGVTIESIHDTCCAFKGVEHRIEYVTEVRGVKYYNDSKGTNPDAAIKGIQAMNRPTCLIGGGYDKELPFDSWIRAFDGKVKFFALIGQTRETIAETAVRCGFPKEKIALFENLEEATKACAAHAEEGDAVLLSPACASWGQFDNYEQRGDMFKQYVYDLAKE